MLLEASSQRMAEPCEAHGAASKSRQKAWLGPASNNVLGRAERVCGGLGLNVLQRM